MQYLVLTKEFFPDYIYPENPTRTDRAIQKIIETDNKVVRVSRLQARELLGHYLKPRGIEGVAWVGERVVRKPARHMLWRLVSPNFVSLLKKKQAYFKNPNDSLFFDYEEEVINIYPERFGTLEQWIIYSIFQYIAVADIALQDDYSIEFDLTKEHADTAFVIRQHVPDALIRHDASQVVIRFRGKNLSSRELATFNPLLEKGLMPSFNFALFPENDNLIDPARVIMREHANDPGFEVADLAQYLCVSRRTLQRRLQEAGTSFVKMKQEERVNFIAGKLKAGNAKEMLSRIAGADNLYSAQKKVTDDD